MTDMFKEVFLGNGIGHSIFILLTLASGSWVMEGVCGALNKPQWSNFIKVVSIFIGTLMVIRLGIQLVYEAAKSLGLN